MIIKKQYIIIYVIFFFSSRRRHTRSKRDWSSDVCSSDLRPDDLLVESKFVDRPLGPNPFNFGPRTKVKRLAWTNSGLSRPEIGRASCRERVWGVVVERAWESSGVRGGHRRMSVTFGVWLG